MCYTHRYLYVQWTDGPQATGPVAVAMYLKIIIRVQSIKSIEDSGSRLIVALWKAEKLQMFDDLQNGPKSIAIASYCLIMSAWMKIDLYNIPQMWNSIEVARNCFLKIYYAKYSLWLSCSYVSIP